MLSSGTGIAHGLRVGIVGGSIAGCVTAAELLRLGCQVAVFERASHLEDRGAGITLPLSVTKKLQERDLIDADMAHIPYFRRRFVIRSEAESRHHGRTIWDQPAASGSASWGVLYRQLRRRVPDAIYHQNCQVMALSAPDKDSMVLSLADGRAWPCDLVVCADGYDSLGRQLLFPDREPQYAGYIFWRGIVEEQLVRDIAPFEDAHTFAVYAGGHALCYLMPGQNGERETGHRRLNWGIYEQVAPQDLPGRLTDAQGMVHRTSLPPGAASDRQVAYVHTLVRTHFPGFVADAVCATTKPFIQAIYDMQVPFYHRGRLCLIGDASTLARPHTGSGSVKAMTDAIALAHALATHASVDEALEAWDQTQCAAGNQLVSLGQALGKSLVTEVPDWHSMGPAEIEQWFATDQLIRRSMRSLYP